MAQSLFGLGGKRGLDSEVSAGLYISDLSCDAQEEEVTVEDHLGEIIGLSMGNGSAELSADGVTVNVATQGQVLGAALGTLANLAIYGTDTPVSEFFINRVRLRRTNKAWEQGGFSARGWTGLTDITATEVT